MDLQTEQSDSMSQKTQPPPPNSQQGQEQEAQQPDLPDQRSDEVVGGDLEESSISGTDEEVVPEGQEELEAVVAEVEAAPEAEIEAAPESSIGQEPAELEPVQYESIQDVVSSLDDMTPEVRSHVGPIVGLLKDVHAEYKVATDQYNKARQELHAFAAEMKDYGVESDVVVKRFETQQHHINTLNAACVNTTWSAFSRLHPEYSGLTQKTKNNFSEIVNSMLDRFPGETTLDKLEGAYKYAQYTTGEIAAKRAETPKAEPKAGVKAEPKPAKPVNVNSKAQSLVADGTTPLSNPVLDVDDMSWNEILNRHLHLLE